jgi:hypothetical protein
MLVRVTLGVLQHVLQERESATPFKGDMRALRPPELCFSVELLVVIHSWSGGIVICLL